MGLTTAGVTAILDDGNEAVFWAAIGSGTTADTQTSNERYQLTLSVSNGVISADTDPPLEYTGTPGADAKYVLLFDQESASGQTYYGYEALTGDQTYNAAGKYSLNSFTITGSSET